MGQISGFPCIQHPSTTATSTGEEEDLLPVAIEEGLAKQQRRTKQRKGDQVEREIRTEQRKGEQQRWTEQRLNLALVALCVSNGREIRCRDGEQQQSLPDSSTAALEMEIRADTCAAQGGAEGGMAYHARTKLHYALLTRFSPLNGGEKNIVGPTARFLLFFHFSSVFSPNQACEIAFFLYFSTLFFTSPPFSPVPSRGLENHTNHCPRGKQDLEKALYLERGCL